MHGKMKALGEIENGYMENSHNFSQVTSRLHTIFMNNKFTSVYYFPFSNKHVSAISRMFVFTHLTTRWRRKKKKRQSHFLIRGILIVFFKILLQVLKAESRYNKLMNFDVTSGFQLENANEKSTSCFIHGTFLFIFRSSCWKWKTNFIPQYCCLKIY